MCVYTVYIYTRIMDILESSLCAGTKVQRELHSLIILNWSVSASIIPPFHFRVRLGELTHTKSSNAYNAPPLRAPEKCCLYWYVQ